MQGKHHGNGYGGGWQPVVRRHGGRGVWRRREDAMIHSVFVDNIPETMGVKGLYSIFSNFGVLQDVFIPNKRRQMKRSRFGFVRYNCSVAADMAVQKTNGLWCEDRALEVKMAEFGKEHGTKRRSTRDPPTRKATEVNHMATVGYQRKQTYAEAVRGRVDVPTTTPIVKAFEEGNDWLLESVVVRLKSANSSDNFRREIARQGFGDIKVRMGGGRDLVLSFQSLADKKDKMVRMQDWLSEWCESVLEWRQGLALEQERLVWLSCYGVPLNLWSYTTFCNIGKTWGAVIGIDDDTLRLNSLQCGKVKIATTSMASINQTINLECRGTIYPVRVCEDQIIIYSAVHEPCISQSNQWKHGEKCSSMGAQDEQIVDKNSRLEEEEADVEVQVVNALRSRCDVDGEGQDLPPTVEAELDGEDRLKDVSVVDESDLRQAGPEEGGACVRDSAIVGTSSKQSVVAVGCGVDGTVYTPGFMKSISGSVGNRAGIQLEVDLNRAHKSPGLIGSSPKAVGPAVVHNSKSNSFTPTQLLDTASCTQRKALMKAKGKRKIKSSTQKQQRKGKMGVTGKLGEASLNLRKGAVFRSAVAAISLSMASSTSRGRLLRSEAEASLQIGKVLGLDCEGQEEEVISKLAALEAQDKQRVRSKEGDVN